MHVELAVPRLVVIHLGASRRGWHLGIRGARGRRILRCQFADLVEWGGAGRGNGSEKTRVARSRDVERRDLRKKKEAIDKLQIIAGAAKEEMKKREKRRAARREKKRGCTWVDGTGYWGGSMMGKDGKKKKKEKTYR